MEIQLSEALTYVHMSIESGDLDSAKAILRTMIRQAHATETEGLNEPDSASLADAVECDETGDAGC